MMMTSVSFLTGLVTWSINPKIAGVSAHYKNRDKKSNISYIISEQNPHDKYSQTNI